MNVKVTYKTIKQKGLGGGGKWNYTVAKFPLFYLKQDNFNFKQRDNLRMHIIIPRNTAKQPKQKDIAKSQHKD